MDQVFGITSEIPEYTYVDRSSLDGTFNYLWKSQKHIVIHGASKQGKSCIRKKNLDETDFILIQCLPDMSCNDIWKTALRTLGASVPKDTIEKKSTDTSDKALGSVGAKIPGILEATISGTTGSSGLDERTSTYSHFNGYDEDIKFLAKQLVKHNKRIILEDFHYLPEERRMDIAFQLKALYELNVFVLIIGIWAEQNLLVYYNGDLSGRIEEINIGWDDSDLFEVLKKGEESLNITFSKEIAEEIVESSFNNVGLLQRIAENICLIEKIYEKQDKIKEINNSKSLDIARKKIVSDISQRYSKIKDVFERGFRAKTELRVYYQIFRFLTEANDEDLIKGIPQNVILKNIQEYSDKLIRPVDLIQALDRIERLQASRGITPLLISYNKSLKEVSLTDREFLFYRKFGNIVWEWLEDGEGTKESGLNKSQVNIMFAEIMIISDKNDGSAELQHPNLGKKVILKNDLELKQIIENLKSRNIKFSLTDRELFGFAFDNIQFYLGFLLKKGFINYELITEDIIEIALTSRGKEKLNISN